MSEIRRACGAGGDCGSCCPMLASMVAQAERPLYRDALDPGYARGDGR